LFVSAFRKIAIEARAAVMISNNPEPIPEVISSNVSGEKKAQVGRGVRKTTKKILTASDICFLGIKYALLDFITF